ncbi:hypothetical protein VTK73DRAFT_3443 [Phialemonium thermophilum]|uniref:FAD-binding PCMH-type domain-containing protein n=1 Tax=Phialemonium thermophilum TaxID=223376 RepID=A0ABR3WYU4_9PEZI
MIEKLHTILLWTALIHGCQTATQASSCKSIPGDATWPSATAWRLLNETVDGRLLIASPPGSVCHTDQTTYDDDRCRAVQSAWSSEFFHADDPVSVEWNNWTNDSCLPDSRAHCTANGYPTFVVNATTPLHVKAGIDFARRHSIRLVVKNSGHDYLGRSTAPNSLSIWVHHMRGVAWHPTSFTPKGCHFSIGGLAMTAGAGTQMIDAYRLAAEMNRTVVGGNGRSVALGGYVTGGGHSILSPRHGLAVDQILEMEMVAPSGDVLTLNECQNADLFWAMRGGGGSTFGVLTSVTMKTYESPRVMNMQFSLTTSAENDHALDAVAYVLGQFPGLVDSGISGYPVVVNSVPIWPGSNQTVPVSGMTGKLAMLDATSPENMTQLFAPILAYLHETWPGEYSFLADITSYPTFYAWYLENYDPTPAGYDNLLGSRLLDRRALTANATATRWALERFAAGGQATVLLVSGKGVFDARPRGGGTSVSPAWRRAYAHAAISAPFLPLNETAQREAIERVNSATEALRELAPDSGAYINEANPWEPDWQRTFWGDNYPRLLQIKRAVDPEDVFWCTPCVGSEGWEERENRLCRVRA